MAGAARAKILIVLIPILAGCTMGSSSYSCKGRPGSPLCRSAAEVYEMTHTKDRLVALEMEGHQLQESAPGTARNENPGHGPQPTIPVEDPMPIRTPAKVMRIWIAPWEDEDGDLIASGYVYTEIEPRRWQIGTREAVHESRVIEPLNPNSPAQPLLPAGAARESGQESDRGRPGNRLSNGRSTNIGGNHE